MPPVGGSLIGKTHADNRRHTYLRAHFMNALVRDPRVVRLFDAWGRETGLHEAADAVARAGAQVARAAKLPRNGIGALSREDQNARGAHDSDRAAAARGTRHAGARAGWPAVAG